MVAPIINYLAVLVSGLAAWVLGALWYSPLLFGKLWMKLSGMKMEDMEKHKKAAMRGYLLGLLTALVMAYVLAHFVDYADATTIAGGLQAGFWAWLGFVATITLGSVLWEGKPFSLYLLNNGYNLVSLLLMGAILAVWV